jgi:hypothetical protein
MKDKEPKERLSFTLTKENVVWLRRITDSSHISMSLFMDAMLTGIRSQAEGHTSEREAMAIAFEQVAKGMSG